MSLVLMTVAEVADWTSQPEEEVRLLTKEGVLPGRYVGRELRFSEEEIGPMYGLDLPGPRSKEIARRRDEAARKMIAAERISQNRTHWVYRLYGEQDELLYVGISNQGVSRLMQHAAEKDWWSKVFTVRIEHLPNRDAALEREAVLINEHLPPFNRAIPRLPA